MQAAKETIGNILELIRNTKELGATIEVDAAGSLVVDFGTAQAPASLVDALRAHRDELKRLYAHTRPDYKPPKPAPRAQPTDALPEWLAPAPAADVSAAYTPVPKVVYQWWQPGLRCSGDTVAVDTETEALDTINDAAGPVPRMVLGTATDGQAGFYLSPATIGPFLREHPDSVFVFHNVAFDAEVIHDVLQARGDSFWPLVDAGRVVCTMEMERLVSLGQWGNARLFPSLDSLTQKYCGLPVVKDAVDDAGNPLRTSFGQFIGKPAEQIPQAYLDYAAGDTTATWAVWKAQQEQVAALRERACMAYGFPGEEQLAKAWQTYGPLTIGTQVKAAILARAMGRQGICFDATRQDAVMQTLRAEQAQAAEQLRGQGIFVPHDPQAEDLPAWEADELKATTGPAVKTSVQRYMEAREQEMLDDGTITEPFQRTDTGRLSMDKETRDSWLERGADPVLLGYARYERARKWQKTYCEKMLAPRAHPKWNHLLNTGRWSCTGTIALQTLPKCGAVPSDTLTLRQCITPGSGFVFVAADYAQIELVSLAAAMQYQTQFGQGLADLIRNGADIHRTLAAELTGKPIDAVTDDERKAVKPVSFGMPGAMGPTTIARVAKNNYRLDLSEERCREIMQAYLRIAPELEQHLAQRVDVGTRVAKVVGLNQAWEGHRLLKVLKGDATTGSGDSLEPDTVAHAWTLAQRFAGIIQGTKKNRLRLIAQLEAREPSKDLHDAVKRAASAESSTTLTGRLRARCSFAAARNNIFQGPVSDGAVLALWRLWRMGYRPALFVHDELVFAVHDDGKAHIHAEHIAQVMQEEMSRVLFGIPVGIEWFASRSFSKRDKLSPGELACNKEDPGTTPGPTTPQPAGQPFGGMQKAGSVKVAAPKARSSKGTGVVQGLNRKRKPFKLADDTPSSQSPDGEGVPPSDDIPF